MILQALGSYYHRLAEESGIDVAAEGFERKEIPFLIEIDSGGRLVALHDIRDGVGKKREGRIFKVPKGVKKTSGIAANLLWDTPNYVLGVPKKTAGKEAKKDQTAVARQQKAAFVRKIVDSLSDALNDDGVRAVLSFLDQADYPELFAHSAWKEIEERGSVVTFKQIGRASCRERV